MYGIYVWHRGLCTTYMYNMDSMSYITNVTHKNYLNKYKTLEYYEIPKSMCGIYVWHRCLCTTHMCNMDYMSYITHVTHKLYLNKYKILEFFRYLNLCVVYMCDIEVYVPHTCATWILCHT